MRWGEGNRNARDRGVRALAPLVRGVERRRHVAVDLSTTLPPARLDLRGDLCSPRQGLKPGLAPFCLP